jgi:ABC-type phosphate transport system substrate-binding protein
MRRRICKFSPARIAVLALAAGALGSFAMASPAMAAAPAGTACQTDGKISGRGSTLQGNALTAFITGYNTDVCGNVAAATNLNAGYTSDPAGSNMIAYNYPEATTAGARGSGEGLGAMACRTDAFGGTDIPYNVGSSTPATGTMPWLWADIPAASPNNWPYFDPAFGSDGSNGCDTFYGNPQVAYTPPYPPAPNAGCADAGPACYPSGTNAAGPVMSFPVAVASAALGVMFKVPPPQPTLGTNTGTGGTARCWEVTSVNAAGQSTASTVIGPANTGGATPETQVLNWTAVPNATSYDIYGAGATGTTCNAFTSTSVVATGVATNTFTDDGSALTAGSVPTSNTAQISGCPTTASQVVLTSSQVSTIFSGDTSTWAALGDESSFNWTTCPLAITRVVRADISGTTQEMKTYLRSVDGSRALCNGGGQTWTTLAEYTNNTAWPGGSPGACSGVTAPLTFLGTGGGAACPGYPLPANSTKGVICGLSDIEGGITYGDLSNWKSTPGVIYAELIPNTGTTPVIPGSSATIGTGTPNCSTAFSTNTPGAGGSTDFVGLDDTGGTPDEPSNTNWATDAANGAGGVTPASDITNIPGSTTWPICTLTYDMVYTGLSEANATYTANPIGGLTADQRRTLYTFFAFVLSPDGQNLLTAAGYKPLPSSWATSERAGFEGGF